MYYHNLHVIRKGSKKLLTIENSNSFVNTLYIPGAHKKRTVNFSGLCSNQQLSFFTLLDRAFFLYSKIIKFGRELFIV